jgi:hypothetical protein
MCEASTKVLAHVQASRFKPALHQLAPPHKGRRAKRARDGGAVSVFADGGERLDALKNVSGASLVIWHVKQEK